MPDGRRRQLRQRHRRHHCPLRRQDDAGLGNPWAASATHNDSGYDASANGVPTNPRDPNWAAHIDLRLIAPGAAGKTGRTTAYTLPASYLSRLAAPPPNFTEPHALAWQARRQAKLRVTRANP